MCHCGQVLESMCGVLARQDGGSEGLRAMAAVLLRTLFDVRSNLWSLVQPHTKTGGITSASRKGYWLSLIHI